MESTFDGKYVETSLGRRIEHWTRHREPPILILLGPPGCGKTFTVVHVLEALSDELTYMWIPATWEASLESMLGVWELVDGQTRFSEGDLLTGLTTNNCITIIDDSHTIAGQLQLLNGFADGKRQISCPALGKRLALSETARLVLIANPPSADAPQWERTRWEIPEQIRDRARMIELSSGLSREEEERIVRANWPEDSHPEDVFQGLMDVVGNLRSAALITSYTPSIRSMVMLCTLLHQGLSLGDAFLEAIGNKFLRADERAIAIDAFAARFDEDPTEGSCVAAAAEGK